MRLLSQCSRAHDFDWSHFRAIDKSFRANDAVQPAIIGIQRMRLRLKNVKSWSSLQKRIFANTNQNTSDSCTQKRSQDGPLRRRIKQFDFFLFGASKPKISNSTREWLCGSEMHDRFHAVSSEVLLRFRRELFSRRRGGEHNVELPILPSLFIHASDHSICDINISAVQLPRWLDRCGVMTNVIATH